MKGFKGFGNFNSHARVGRDNRQHSRQPGTADFNSHARVGRDLSDLFSVRRPANFNSHARVGRDTDAMLKLMERLISTHTPV